MFAGDDQGEEQSEKKQAECERENGQHDNFLQNAFMINLVL
jgi:hypothetical protein